MTARKISEEWECTECGSKYSAERNAERCCEKKKKDWTQVTVFELKQSHLDLLKQSCIDWDDCEYGAPGINPKRPYGNSDVEDDIANIVKLEKNGNWDRENEIWNEKAQAILNDLHRQTQVALEIILHCQSFKLGKYKKKEEYADEWNYVGVD